MEPNDPLDQLRAIYDSLPKLKCKKLCHESCGPIFWSEIEDRVIMSKTGGLRLTIHPATSACPYLTNKKECLIYENRPLLCRLWGMVDDPKMRCPHGCEPDFWLTNAEARILLRQADEIKATRFFGEKN